MFGSHHVINMSKFIFFVILIIVYVFALIYIKNKTTAAVCISRRALKGKKYLFQDIHNFSFSAKIQDGRQK